MATPIVNAESNLSDKKTRKPRAAKPAQPLSNYDQILAAASGLSPKEKAMLSLDMKKQALTENERDMNTAKETADLLRSVDFEGKV